MIANHRASTASHLDSLMLQRIQPDVHDRAFKFQLKALVVESYLFENINIEFPARHQQLFSLSAEQFCGLLVGQMRQFILQRSHIASPITIRSHAFSVY